MKDNKTIFKATFWPAQVAIAVESGVPKLIFGVTEHMRNNESHVLIKLDFTNAFNTVWEKRSAASLSEQAGVETPVPFLLVHTLAKIHNPWDK